MVHFFGEHPFGKISEKIYFFQLIFLFCDIMRYYERIVEEKIESKLTDERILDIVGPRECGKTTVAARFANSTISIDENYSSYEKLSEFKPELLLEGEKPLLIDDIEKLPALKGLIIRSSKRVHNNGLYITTNSKSPKNPIKMYPMSLYESGDSLGEVKLMDLFKNPSMDIDGIESHLELEELIEVTCRGGFPNALKNPDDIDSYVTRVICNYMTDVDGSRKDHLKVAAILRTYADNISSFKPNIDLLNLARVDCPNLAKSTYYRYINGLKDLYVIDEVPSWNVKLKAASAVRKASKKAFCDPAIAISVLNLTPRDLLFDLEKFECIFKNLCLRDLRVYSQIRDGKISYYADRYGSEVDCILEIDNGDYALINFSLSSQRLETSIKQLIALRDLISSKVDAGKLTIRKPKFLAIITASSHAYTHKDGVKIIPIGVLG